MNPAGTEFDATCHVAKTVLVAICIAPHTPGFAVMAVIRVGTDPDVTSDVATIVKVVETIA